jgi:glycosyltransferase involved in cell wall biosynthesis
LTKKQKTKPPFAPLWAILIPSLDFRWKKLAKLRGELLHQILKGNYQDKVVIMAYVDEGKLSTGRKRNTLKRRADAEYISYFDDDDFPSPDYVERIMTTLEANPKIDCVNFVVEYSCDGLGKFPIKFSKRYPKYVQEVGCYFRPPGHLSVIKREKVKSIAFPDITIGEDVDWALELVDKKVIKKEANLPDILYFYKYSSVKYVPR